MENPILPLFAPQTLTNQKPVFVPRHPGPIVETLQTLLINTGACAKRPRNYC